MKIILPLSFITMKLLGCFIDFMISLINSESTGNAKSIPSLNMTNLRLTAISDLNEFAIVKSKVGPFYFDDLQEWSRSWIMILDWLFEWWHGPILKQLLGEYLSDNFSPRTCIRPTLTPQSGPDGDYIMVSYQSLTTQRVLSDEGRNCLNDIELAYLFFLAFTLVIGFGTAYKPSDLTHDLGCSMIELLSWTMVI